VKNSEGQAEKPSAPLGPLEFAILGGLAILLVIAFTALFGEDIQSWIADITADQPPPQISIAIQETGGSTEPLDQEVIVVDNCDQDQEIVEDVLRSRQFRPVFQFEEDFEPEVEEALTVQLEAYYGFQQGEEVDRVFNLQLTASAESQAEYTIEWQYVWTEGVLQITWQDGSEDEFVYQGLTDVEFRTLNISQSDCP
jgi:hypothetical protein